MRDDEQRAVEGGEELLEPGEAVGVEVVGGLVEQQDVGVLEQRRRPAARGPARRRRGAAAGGAGSRWSMREPAPDLLGARLGRPRAGRLGARRGRGRRRRGRPGSLRALRAPRPASPRASRSRSSSVACRRAPPAAGSRRSRRRRDRAAVGLLAPGQQAQQRRLAGAVGADEAGALAGVEGQRQPFEEGRAVIAFRQVECAIARVKLQGPGTAAAAAEVVGTDLALHGDEGTRPRAGRAVRLTATSCAARGRRRRGAVTRSASSAPAAPGRSGGGCGARRGGVAMRDRRRPSGSGRDHCGRRRRARPRWMCMSRPRRTMRPCSRSAARLGGVELGVERRLEAGGAQPLLELRGRRVSSAGSGAAGSGSGAGGGSGSGSPRSSRASRASRSRLGPWRGGSGSSTTPPPSVSGGASDRITSRSPRARHERLLEPELEVAAAELGEPRRASRACRGGRRRARRRPAARRA